MSALGGIVSTTDVATQADLTTHAAAADPHSVYVREADTNYTALIGGGQTTLHTHQAGYQPYAFPIGGRPDAVTTTALALAANGGAIAIPITLEGFMLLQSVSFWNTDTGTARGPADFALYQDVLNNSNSLVQVAGAVGALTSWTPSAASARTISVTSPPITLPPGVYWLVIKNRHASNTLGLGTAAAGTLALSTMQTKNLGAGALPASLDFVAATWTKVTTLAGVRLNARMFGQGASF